MTNEMEEERVDDPTLYSVLVRAPRKRARIMRMVELYRQVAEAFSNELENLLEKDSFPETQKALAQLSKTLHGYRDLSTESEGVWHVLKTKLNLSSYHGMDREFPIKSIEFSLPSYFDMRAQGNGLQQMGDWDDHKVRIKLDDGQKLDLPLEALPKLRSKRKREQARNPAEAENTLPAVGGGR